MTRRIVQGAFWTTALLLAYAALHIVASIPSILLR